MTIDFFLGRGGPALSHIFFVDDLVLFSEATMQNEEVMQGILNDFY